MKEIITLMMKLMTILDGGVSLLPHFLRILQKQVMWWMKDILTIFFHLRKIITRRCQVLLMPKKKDCISFNELLVSKPLQESHNRAKLIEISFANQVKPLSLHAMNINNKEHWIGYSQSHIVTSNEYIGRMWQKAMGKETSNDENKWNNFKKVVDLLIVVEHSIQRNFEQSNWQCWIVWL